MEAFSLNEDSDPRALMILNFNILDTVPIYCGSDRSWDLFGATKLDTLLKTPINSTFLFGS